LHYVTGSRNAGLRYIPGLNGAKIGATSGEVKSIKRDGVLLRGEINTYKIECSGCEMALVPVNWWLVYGYGVPATAITMTNR